MRKPYIVVWWCDHVYVGRPLLVMIHCKECHRIRKKRLSKQVTLQNSFCFVCLLFRAKHIHVAIYQEFMYRFESVVLPFFPAYLLTFRWNFSVFHFSATQILFLSSFWYFILYTLAILQIFFFFVLIVRASKLAIFDHQILLKFYTTNQQMQTWISMTSVSFLIRTVNALCSCKFHDRNMYNLFTL